MFEITAEDIALLGDKDLRELVGRLCESEITRQGFSPSYVTYGGHQDAPDGGIDARVALPSDTRIDGFIPRPATGFQAKAEDMPRADILAEMRPKGAIRPAIQRLANQSGAYIIVSSKGSTSDTALQDRLDSMAEAVNDLTTSGNLKLDFYDRTRIATWVRENQLVIPWVREKIGRPLRQWRSYGDWARTPDGVSDVYLVDEGARMRTGKGDLIRTLEGIKRIRDTLRRASGVVRLVGLSGVGKTRIVQALFDERVGEDSLDGSLAAYANMADEPDPQPTGLASDFVMAKTRAIFVVDNCSPDLHRRLSDVCRTPGSSVSVITVEHDILDDQPEGTEVFKLDPSSQDLVENLIKDRFPQISIVNVRTIARFSGGNARIAIALAAGVGTHETIADLRDEELVRRLIQQGHAPNPALQLAVEACSLVYSFQVDDGPEGPPDLARFGALVGQSGAEIFRHVAELRRRDLVQRRSIWAAVLPQALADRLAGRALQNITYGSIERQLLSDAPERLWKSFSRRLGDLHHSPEAREIVQRWLAVGGLLGDAATISDFAFTMFVSVAPADAEAVLRSLERSLLGQADSEVIEKCARYAHLLHHIAYEPTLFERCIELLSIIAGPGATGHDDRESQKAFSSLFFLYYSGTQAPPNLRLQVISSLITSANEKRGRLGYLAMKAALESYYFDAVYDFEFGAHPRDHGYWPKDEAEARGWYSQGLVICETLACSEGPAKEFARAALAEQFSSLWNGPRFFDELERAARAISQKGFWREGWLAVRHTMNVSAQPSADISARLADLERALRPRDLLQEVRSIVLSKKVTGYGSDEFGDYVDDDPLSKFDRRESISRGLGKAVAQDQNTFDALLPELVSSDGSLWSFGRGLAENTHDPATTWDRLVAQLASLPVENQRVQALRGFLHGLSSTTPELANHLLEGAVEHSTLSKWYPWLAVSIDIDKQGVIRLRRSLTVGSAPISGYRNLSGGRASDPIPGDDFRSLVLEIAAKPEGLPVALDIVYMRLHSEKDRKSLTPEVIDSGRRLLQQVKFTKGNDREDYDLEEIGRMCLDGDQGAQIVREVCLRLRDAVSTYETFAFRHDGLLNGFLAAQPIATLDGLLGGNAAEIRVGSRIFSDVGRLKVNLLAQVPKGSLFAWCDLEPKVRYSAVAALIPVFRESKAGGRVRWTARALGLLRRAPDRVEVLKQFVQRFEGGGGWVGSVATSLESRATLLDYLGACDDPILMAYLPEAKTRIRQAIEWHRQMETATDKQADERFEW
jgi:hypothetical protein